MTWYISPKSNKSSLIYLNLIKTCRNYLFRMKDIDPENQLVVKAAVKGGTIKEILTIILVKGSYISHQRASEPKILYITSWSKRTEWV